MTQTHNRLAALGLEPQNVFVLYPENAAFLTEERLIPAMQPTVITIRYFLGGAVLLLILGLSAVESILGRIVHPVYLSGMSALVAIAVTVVCMLFLLIGLYCLLMAFRLFQFRRRQITEWQTASLIVGQLLTCAAYSRSHSTIGSNVIFHYQYQSPVSEETIKGEATVDRDDLNSENLPKPGTPVIVVVYHPIIPAANLFNHNKEQGFVL